MERRHQEVEVGAAVSATNWEDVYRVQTERIPELEREIASLRAHAERVGQANDRLAVENAALRKDKARLDFLGTLTGSGWACLHLDSKGTNDDWFLTRKQIDRRMATEPKL